MSVVLDASVVIGWILPDEDALFVPLQRTTVLHVPSLLAYEVVHAMQKAFRRSRLTEDGAKRGFDLLDSLPLKYHVAASGPREVWTFAAAHNVNAYDSAYLEPALRLNLPLATTDAKLADAARRAGVAVF